MKKFPALLSLFAALLLSACILVADFGAAWEEAKPDICLTKIAESLYYAEYRRDPTGKDMAELARGWSIGDASFLLLKKDAKEAGGRLYRFNVVNGIFQRYRLNPTKRKEFERDHPNAPVSLARDTVTLKQMDDASRKLLAEIAAKPDYWEIEDQILYNTLRNPLCRFEDRNLKTLDK